MKYVQSFYQYPVTFSTVGVIIPARSAQGERRNIAEVTEKQLERLINCEPRFRELVDQKKYRILNKVPLSYVPPAEQINKANTEAEALRAKVAELEKKLAESEIGKVPAEETISDGATTDDVDSTDPTPAEETKKTSSSKKGKK